MVHGGVGVWLVLSLAGCATVRKDVPLPVPPVPVPVERKGVQHKVHKGETLWRIAKTYQVTVEDIIQSNGIPNAASIEENQLVFIPGADAVRQVAPVSSSESGTDYDWPLHGKVFSYFQDGGGAAVNRGIDIKAVEGEIVRASRDGKVVFADHLAGYGETVILDHGDGFSTVYGHNARLMVKLGEEVARGARLAQVARDGELSYLHFEVRKGDKATNPLYYLP
jgi:murein DD-endopeptidase MepM/ murein hydrolase activator NlpD